jgi:hypothetical protein
MPVELAEIKCEVLAPLGFLFLASLRETSSFQILNLNYDSNFGLRALVFR